MPRITHVFKTYFPYTSGGLEEAIRQCGTYAAGRGFDVEVVSVGPSNVSFREPDGLTARFFKKSIDLFSNPVSFSLARQFKDICRHSDLLHFHFPWPTAEILALVNQPGIPSVVTFHCDVHRSMVLKPFYLPLVRRFLRRMDRICVTSRPLFRNTPYLKPFKHKVQQIPLFMNEQRFSGLGPPDADVIRRIDPHKPFALFVGVLRWYKGLDILLDAALNTRAQIIIVGVGPLYEHLARRIKKEKITNVRLLGFLEDATLKWLIRHCAMIALPSTAPAEAFGQILLEGLYFGRPLVSTELGTGTSLVNRHGYTGLVIRPGCAGSLALAMNTLIADSAMADRFSQTPGIIISVISPLSGRERNICRFTGICCIPDQSRSDLTSCCVVRPNRWNVFSGECVLVCCLAFKLHN